MKMLSVQVSDENIHVQDTSLDYNNKTNYENVHFKTVRKRQRKDKIEALIKLVEESGIEDIKNTQLKGEMWKNIAKD